MGFGDLFRSSKKHSSKHTSSSSRRAHSPEPFPSQFSSFDEIRPWLSGDRRAEFLPPSIYDTPTPSRSHSSRRPARPITPPRREYTSSRSPFQSTRSRPVSPLGYSDYSRSSSRRPRSPVSPLSAPRESSRRREGSRREPAPRYGGSSSYDLPDFSRSPRREYDDLDYLGSGRRQPPSSYGRSGQPERRPSHSSSRRAASPASSGYGGVDLSSLGGGYNPYGGYQTREYRPGGY